MRICLLTYRGYRYSGGQGIYVRYLSRSLRDLGHEIEVISGPPYPDLDDGIKLIKLPSLDLYTMPESRRLLINPAKLNSTPNLVEWLGECCGFFTEPLTFGMRAHRFLCNGSNGHSQYDIVHDNQSLSYGILKIKESGVPLVATIHHPITIDRDLAINASKSLWQKMGVKRWYSFANVQLKVAKKLAHFITGSYTAYQHIHDIFKIPRERLRIVHYGIDDSVFKQANEVARLENRLLVINSGDTPLKGLKFLLEAVAALRKERNLELVIVGKPLKNGYTDGIIDELAIDDCVSYTGQIDTAELVRHYSMAAMVVVPSVYEGFSLPAAEAMSCNVPVISTTAGALPEVIGDAGIMVPPADTKALVDAITGLLDNPDRRKQLGEMGRKRVRQMFNWHNTAKQTTDVYMEAIEYQKSTVAR